ncbi:uncharacterized protein LACBIDRAFT_313077 [Laccaria bicolor S238N-H82]|uniref:Predicted protein n=1 Tax=Laccaria bicolor (strain S238N-H82 / ATCC MYA-4686) TaxID=486041 RepID=B0DXH0_LACBS|nr:uncharacterized protein LACBIDRAFT_313077 [Laccaria bicolor S238N-H82]EDR00677.1 predicted protein [Laccaria bicolor S238N-H82]|eukprot:XP_001888686.1 predicted protein [Laccaria bicolor S238N-H82]
MHTLPAFERLLARSALGEKEGWEMDVKAEVKEVERTADVLDISVEDSEIWVKRNERVYLFEKIIARLWDKLGTARNVNVMFGVFSRFSPGQTFVVRCGSTRLIL